MKKLGAFSCILLVAFAGIGPLLDHAVFPEKEPGEEYYPPEGYTFRSELEGFTQRVVKREKGLMWVELTLDPHAEGPPPHVHTSFAERFRVSEGAISLLLGEEVVRVGLGEETLVPPGTVHKPFNPNDVKAVVSAPLSQEYAMPEKFGVFLLQAYGYFDESPSNNQPPRTLLQMSRFSPTYDSWLGGPPVNLQRALFWVLGPVARALGYRSYYERFAPGNRLES